MAPADRQDHREADGARSDTDRDVQMHGAADERHESGRQSDSQGREPWYSANLRFLRRVLGASLRIAAFFWFFWLHQLVETKMHAIVSTADLSGQIVGGGTRLAFIGLALSLLLDMLMCFWRDE